MATLRIDKWGEKSATQHGRLQTAAPKMECEIYLWSLENLDI